MRESLPSADVVLKYTVSSFDQSCMIVHCSCQTIVLRHWARPFGQDLCAIYSERALSTGNSRYLVCAGESFPSGEFFAHCELEYRVILCWSRP